MPTFYTDISTQQLGGRGDTRLDGSVVTGNHQVFRATYTTSGTEAAADIVVIGKLPTGARVTGARIYNEACGGTGFAVSKIGTAAADNSLSATSVGLTTAASTLVTQAAGLPLAASDGQTDLIATLALSSGSVTAGKKVVFDIHYFV